jgi:uncharacterized protein YdhG (YjbR/CyaY superfamily)
MLFSTGNFDRIQIKFRVMRKTKAVNIDEYIAEYPKDIQKILKDIRLTVSKAAPKAEEAIKYYMPAFVYHGHLALFAVFKTHIGFYPAPTANPDFKKELSAYKTGKGSVQFPLDKPMPLRLITKMVKYQLAKNIEKEKKKNKVK